MEPIILICFDRNLNLLARFLYCDRDHYTAAQLAFLMAQNREAQQHRHPPHPHAAHNHLLQHQPNHQFGSHQHGTHLPGDEECDQYGDNGLGACAAGDDTEEAMALQNSIELGGEAFHESRARKYRHGGDLGMGELGGMDSLGRGRAGRSVSPLANSLLPAPPAPPCRHCSPVLHASETAPFRPTARYASGNDSSSAATRELRGLVPDTPLGGHRDESYELQFSPLSLREDYAHDPLGYKSSRAARRSHGDDDEGDVAF